MSNFIYGTHPKFAEDVKICTYAICKDELVHVHHWLDSIWAGGNGSDYIVVLDTGSTDGTYEELIKYGEALDKYINFFTKYNVTDIVNFDFSDETNGKNDFI